MFSFPYQRHWFNLPDHVWAAMELVWSRIEPEDDFWTRYRISRILRNLVKNNQPEKTK